MNTVILKILAAILLVFGEVFAIYAEMKGANDFHLDNASFWSILLKMSGVCFLAAICLIGGYMLGIKYFKNIYIVTVISITSILIVEPLIAYAFFKEMPTTGAMIGFGLGALGFIATVIL